MSPRSSTGRVGPARVRARRLRSPLPQGHRGDPVAAAHGIPPERSVRSSLAEQRPECPKPRRLQDWTAQRAVRLGRAGVHRGVAPRATPTPSCFHTTPKAGISGLSRTAGGRPASMRSSAGCACTTCATRRPPRRSWRAKICLSWARCAAIGGTGPRRVTFTLPMSTLSRRLKGLALLSQPQWRQNAKILRAR